MRPEEATHHGPGTTTVGQEVGQQPCPGSSVERWLAGGEALEEGAGLAGVVNARPRREEGENERGDYETRGILVEKTGRGNHRQQQKYTS